MLSATIKDCTIKFKFENFKFKNLVVKREKKLNQIVLQTQSNFRSNQVVPRILGSIEGPWNGVACQLVGWGGGDVYSSRRDVIGVYRPDLCDSSLPEVFCSTFPIASTESCSAILGAPLICENESTISGFLLNDRNCEVNSNGRNQLNFHSVDQYKKWIEEVLETNSVRKISINLILLAFIALLKICL